MVAVYIDLAVVLHSEAHLSHETIKSLLSNGAIFIL